MSGPSPTSTTGASIVAIIDGLDATDLGESHGKPSQLHVKIFVDDGKEPVKKMVLENRNSTYKIPQPIDLNVNPSSVLKIMVYRKSRGFRGNIPIGQISNRISELITAIEPSRRRLNEKDLAAGYIQILMRIDTSASRTVNELGLQHASRVLENAQNRLENRRDDDRAFGATSSVVDQALEYAAVAQSGYSEAQKASESLGLLGEALIHLDRFVQLMDGLTTAHPMVQCAWAVLSCVYKALKQQLEQDASIKHLALQLRDVLAYAQACRDLKAIRGGTDTIREMGRLVVEGGSLIDECMRHGFLRRAAKSALSSDLQNRIQQCERQLNTIEKIFTTTLAIRNYQHNQDAKREKVLEWLSPGRFDGRHASVRESRSENTGNWIVDVLEANNWLTEKGLLLVGTGDPGIGKTYLCSFVIDHMLSLRAEHNYGVAYFYFSVDRANEHSLHHVLSSLTKQLTAQKKPLIDEVERLYNESQDGKTTPASDQLKTAISSIVSAETFSRMFLVFDAFDECKKEFQSSFVSLFKEMADGGMSVFVTSRPNIQEIHALLGSARMVSLSAKEYDLRTYLQKRIDANRLLANVVSDYHRNGGKDVIATLIEAVNGMFLFAWYCADRLQDVGTVADLLEELRDLKQSSGKGEYGAMYDSIIRRIRQQPDRSKELALRTLCWLIKSWQALSIQHLQVAVSVKRNQTALAIDALQPPERIIEVCAGLVVMDKATNSVRLSHATAREYLLQTPSILTPDPGWVLVETCATYLSFDVFKAGACTTEEDFRARLSLHRFLYYAAMQIMRHSRICDEHLSTDVILKFLEHEGSLSSCLQALDSDGYVHRFDGYPKGHSALHAACRIAHVSATRRLLERGAVATTHENQPISLHGAAASGNGVGAAPVVGVAGLDVRDSWGLTPLHWAAMLGHTEIAKLLIEKGAELSVQDNNGKTPLYLAAQQGHEEIAKLFIDKGAQLSVQYSNGMTPLHWAAWYGNDAIMKLLVKKGAEILVRDCWGMTPLHWAASKGHDAIAKLLIENGAELSAQDSIGYTPLYLASKDGHETTAKLLLENGAEISVQCNDGETPLHSAARCGCTAVVKLLVEKGAGLSVQDCDGKTPLHRAVSNRHEAIAKLLIEKGADFSVRSSRGETPLHCTAQFGHEVIAKLLLEKGAEVSVRDTRQKTPLHWAAQNGHEALSRLLVEKGAEVSAQDGDGETPLLCTAKNGHEAIANLLVENGAELSVPGEYGDTPLHWAASRGYEAIAKLLVDKGAEVSMRNINRDTPLLGAAEYGHDAIAKLLIEKGVDVSVEGSDGMTPLHRAARNGYEGMAKLLVEKGAGLSVRDSSGMTPLHCAASDGHEAIVKLLVENGAELSGQNDDGDTPLQCAKREGHESIVKLLEQYS